MNSSVTSTSPFSCSVYSLANVLELDSEVKEGRLFPNASIFSLSRQLHLLWEQQLGKETRASRNRMCANGAATFQLIFNYTRGNANRVLFTAKRLFNG